jgi:hypothetical protein
MRVHSKHVKEQAEADEAEEAAEAAPAISNQQSARHLIVCPSQQWMAATHN